MKAPEVYQDGGTSPEDRFGKGKRNQDDFYKSCGLIELTRTRPPNSKVVGSPLATFNSDALLSENCNDKNK